MIDIELDNLQDIRESPRENVKCSGFCNLHETEIKTNGTGSLTIDAGKL